ncbi:MAG: SRPBCC family protein [Bacteroidota bacterium]
MNIKVSRKINAPKEELWAYLADFNNIHRFHPLLKGSAYIEGASSCELGTTRQCDFKDGTYIKERVTELKEGSHYTVDIYEASMPIKNAQATLGVKEISANETEAFMDMSMVPKYAFLTPVMYLMFRFFAAPSILKGLEKIWTAEKKLSLA